MSAKQIAALRYIAAHPGCTAADVTRYEWSPARGHSATYDRVARLARRGYITRSPDGARLRLTISPSGAAHLV